MSSQWFILLLLRCFKSNLDSLTQQSIISIHFSPQPILLRSQFAVLLGPFLYFSILSFLSGTSSWTFCTWFPFCNRSNYFSDLYTCPAQLNRLLFITIDSHFSIQVLDLLVCPYLILSFVVNFGSINSSQYHPFKNCLFKFVRFCVAHALYAYNNWTHQSFVKRYFLLP